MRKWMMLIGVNLVFGALTGLGLYWWPAWVIEGAAYAGVLVALWWTGREMKRLRRQMRRAPEYGPRHQFRPYPIWDAPDDEKGGE